MRSVLYTAYNHRFEPHYVRVRDLVRSGALGPSIAAACSMETARRGSSAIPPGATLAPASSPISARTCSTRHVSGSTTSRTISALRRPAVLRTARCDHVVIASEQSRPKLELEMTLLSWRNHFVCDIFAERGSAHVSSLCKWGPTTFTVRKRILPSGRPVEESTTLIQDDPTWALEYDHFKRLVAEGKPDRSRQRPVAASRARAPGARREHGKRREPANMSTPVKIAYVGMTHLGLCSAIAAASKGFDTLGFDFNASLVGEINDGKLPVTEPGLDALLHDNRQRISFTSDPGKLSDRDVIYVAPDVPTDELGQSDLTMLERFLACVLEAARPDAVIVILSQVSPGFTRAHQRAGRQIYYQVETLVFGRAVERATLPERFIVGCPGDPRDPLPAALAVLSRGLRLSDPAHAPRKRRARQDLHQLLSRRLDRGRQHAGGAVRAHRCRLVGDRSRIEARCAHRTLFLPRAGARHRRRQPRA